MKIFVHRNGQQLGPFSESDIRTQLASGAISPADLVWWEGQAGWVPLSRTPYAAASVPPAVPLPAATGAPPPPPPVPMPATPAVLAAAGKAKPSSNLAIASLICGILGLFVCSIFTAIPAIITGHMARRQIRENPTLEGAGLALGGLIMGYIACGLLLLVIPISILIALGNNVSNVFSAISSQLQTEQSTDSSTPTTNSPDSTSPTATPVTNNQ
jgi:hypothetical protein